MVDSKIQRVLVGIFVVLAVFIIVLAAVLFFRPQKELTGNKFLDCMDKDISINRLERCFEKYPTYIDKERKDEELYGRAVASKDAAFCNEITADDIKFVCIVGVTNDKTSCLLIKNEFAKAICLGRWEADSCDNLSGEEKRDCSVEISKDPEKCLLLPEEERAFCIALKKKDPLLCPPLPTYYQQIRCMLESDKSYLQKLEEYDLFRNFLDIALKENQSVSCDSVEDENLRKVCIEKFQLT